MNKVFVLIGANYRDEQIAGVFSSEEKASEAKRKMEEEFEDYFFSISVENIDPKRIEWSTGTDIIRIRL
jgi:hypothetical protein